jgi:hypothetical protein
MVESPTVVNLVLDDPAPLARLPSSEITVEHETHE